MLTRTYTTSFWRGAALLLCCAGAFIFDEKSVARTSCAWAKRRIDIGSGAGYFTGSMETYDMSNGAGADEEE